MKKISSVHRFVAVANGKFLEYSKKYLKQDSIYACDPLLMAAVVWEDFVLETEMCHASCMTDKNETYGQVIFYRKDYTYDTMPSFDNYNVEVITKIKAADFVSRYIKSINGR